MQEQITNNDVVAIPYLLEKKHIQHHLEEFQNMMYYSSRQEVMDELAEIKSQLKRPIVAIQRFAKTKHAAAYMDVDPSFLDKKRREGIFELGIHYHKPKGSSLVLWDTNALEEWITAEEVDDDNSQIIDKMFA